MSKQRYNTTEFERVEIPEFDPQKFAKKIRAAYTQTIAKELPGELLDRTRAECASLGITDEAAVVLRAIAILSAGYVSPGSAPKRQRYRMPVIPQDTSGGAAEEAARSYTIYTDGACEGNPGAGGWGAIVVDCDGVEEEYSGWDATTTNNRMELMAAIKALESIPDGSTVKVYSDAQYVVEGIAKGWARAWQAHNWCRANGKPAMNPDLWERLLSVIDQHKKVDFIWIKGHAGNPYNERCDRLAVNAASVAARRDAAKSDLH